jgi:hypothetical protein
VYVKFVLSNQRGISLVQVMLSGAMMATFGVVWMGYMKNAARDERRLDVKAEVRQVENMVSEILGDPQAAFRNFGDAFRGKDRIIPHTPGPRTEQLDVLRARPYERDGELFEGKAILTRGLPIGRRMLHVRSIAFIINNVENVLLDAWRADVRISIELLYCPDGGHYYRYTSTENPPGNIVFTGIQGAPLCETPVIRNIIKEGTVNFEVFPTGDSRAGELLEQDLP